jgi:hypothetical protein
MHCVTCGDEGQEGIKVLFVLSVHAVITLNEGLSSHWQHGPLTLYKVF